MSSLHAPALPAHSRRNIFESIAGGHSMDLRSWPLSACAEAGSTTPAQVAREVRDYRMANEDDGANSRIPFDSQYCQRHSQHSENTVI